MKAKLLNSDSSILLIIDIQEKLLPAQFNKENIAKNAQILAETAKILNIPVVVSEQYPKGLGATIQEIKDKLPENTVFFEKTNFDCCSEEGFLNIINNFNRTQILVCGMESHICVHQTVYNLIEKSYEVHIIKDAISSRKEWEYEQGIQKMLFNGAVPSSIEIALFELLKHAKHPDFKAIQSLIK